MPSARTCPLGDFAHVLVVADRERQLQQCEAAVGDVCGARTSQRRGPRCLVLAFSDPWTVIARSRVRVPVLLLGRFALLQ